MSEAELLLRIVLAAVLGGIIGWEREKHHRTAGLRTHMLVALGSCLFTIISLLLLTKLDSYTRVDPTRIAAGVVAGIGFLGAGAILHSKKGIMGLTTATGLWVVAAIGMATGFGYPILAGGTAILTVLILFVLEKVERAID